MIVSGQQTVVCNKLLSFWESCLFRIAHTELRMQSPPHWVVLSSFDQMREQIWAAKRITPRV